MTTKEIGDYGERVAARYLENKGYEIIDCNFRMKMGEIDIIAESDATTVFVEVKTRKSNIYGEPSEYVNGKKQEHIKKTAMVYMKSTDMDVRFDVIEVMYELRYGEMEITKINHIEGAF